MDFEIRHVSRRNLACKVSTFWRRQGLCLPAGSPGYVPCEATLVMFVHCIIDNIAGKCGRTNTVSLQTILDALEIIKATGRRSGCRRALVPGSVCHLHVLPLLPCLGPPYEGRRKSVSAATPILFEMPG